MNKKSDKFWKFWDRFGALVILFVIALIYGILDPRILEPAQISTVLARTATVGICATGMMLAIVAGGFDLSVGSIVSLVTCVIAINIQNGLSVAVSVILGLVVGMLCGLVNGLIITKLKIQTFVATLATQLAFAGVASVYSNGEITSITNGPGIKFFATYKLFGFLSMQIVLLVAAFLALAFLYSRTRFGVKVRAIGSNEMAARTSGINVDRTLIGVFVLTGLVAGCSGVLFSSRLSCGNPVIGAGFELDVITSVILGGTALSGGKGNVFGTFVGAVILAFVQMGLNILNVGEAYQKLAVAIVLLLALSISGIRLITQREGK